MHVHNLAGQRFLLGYGEKDRLVPIKYIRQYMHLFQSVGVDLDWYSIADKAHQLDLSDERIQEFVTFLYTNRRDTFPDHLIWSTEDAGRYSRRSWLRSDELAEFPRGFKVDTTGILPRWGTSLQRRGKTAPRVPYGTVELTREGNHIEVTSSHVRALTLLLAPSEFDFSKEVRGRVNGKDVRSGVPPASISTLLHWAARDDDRVRLFGAEWKVQVP